MARLVVSARSEKVKMVLDGILTLPMVLPPTVAGFFLLMIFGVKRPLGQLFLELFGVKIVFSWAATVIAAVAISFPLMYRAARGAFEQVDVTLIYAARTLGFSESRIFHQPAAAEAESRLFIPKLCIVSEYDRRNQHCSGAFGQQGGKTGGSCPHDPPL